MSDNEKFLAQLDIAIAQLEEQYILEFDPDIDKALQAAITTRNIMRRTREDSDS
jgi:hypothetical protein